MSYTSNWHLHLHSFPGPLPPVHMVLTSCDARPHQPWAAPRHCCTAQAQARLAEPWSPEPSPRGPWGLSPGTQSTLRAGAGVRKETGGKEGRIWMIEGITLLVQLQSYKGSRCSCSVPQSFLILCDPMDCSMQASLSISHFRSSINFSLPKTTNSFLSTSQKTGSTIFNQLLYLLYPLKLELLCIFPSHPH